MPRYDQAQICLSGHVVNEATYRFPEASTAFCADCGEKTIRECQHCEHPIRGAAEGMVGFVDAPNYCRQCGKAYPWTERNTRALDELIAELDELGDEGRALLKRSIPDIVAETPGSGVAVIRFKKAATKVGPVAAKLILDILGKVAAAAVKAQIGL